ncbi:MAG: hypothetical protein WC765_09705, partial [Phycisphaerae bacterium]
MLALPTRGISRSINEHNSDLDIMCDWIEGSVLFGDNELSSTDIVDMLVEGNIYDDPDMGFEMVSDVWTEIRRRQSWIGNNTPFSINANRITKIQKWQNVPGYSFCLITSLAALYPSELRQVSRNNYTEQGMLFEELTKASLEHQFTDWQFYLTGWSRKKTNQIEKKVAEIAARLQENVGNIKRWITNEKKDAGLDLLCYRPFRDNRVGIPVYLMQCASGQNWEDKLHEPVLEIWKHVIDFACLPKKAFSMPFALDDSKFLSTCALVDGMLMDR